MAFKDAILLTVGPSSITTFSACFLFLPFFSFLISCCVWSRISSSFFLYFLQGAFSFEFDFFVVFLLELVSFSVIATFFSPSIVLISASISFFVIFLLNLPSLPFCFPLAPLKSSCSFLVPGVVSSDEVLDLGLIGSYIADKIAPAFKQAVRLVWGDLGLILVLILGDVDICFLAVFFCIDFMVGDFEVALTGVVFEGDFVDNLLAVFVGDLIGSFFLISTFIFILGLAFLVSIKSGDFEIFFLVAWAGTEDFV